MNLSKQIKKYRTRDQFSQEELAQKLYVSRQTISNWENERSYPDIHNLLLMSVLFNVSLDDLVKGDVEMMRNELQGAQMNKWTISMVTFSLLGAISIGPMMNWFGTKGLLVSFVLIAYSIYSAFKVENIKKKHNLKTYKEILAFQEGRQLTDEEKGEGRKKNKYIKVMMVISSGLITGILTWLSLTFFN
ncbi:transcriptional regulator [Lysinibacillus contaminans]|uniref:Transcriptional regulator n=1 Tax=Lysinibacillus contaminans TaxID=1293441 RepID=A0ABR5JWE5_9BACI|nr:helix-turn-helix transcriptional regulator [Lysinibacillus contaminans]KOS66270.1 transcriptional regulator [Lysinibacillus contaminans]